MILDVGHDGFDQSTLTVEGSSTKPLIGNFTEPTLDHVKPRAGSRDKVQMETRMPSQPGYDTRMFMSAVIVHDQMQVQPRRGVRIDALEETDKFLMSMARHAIADHFAVEHAQRGKQGGSSVTLVVVGLAGRDSRTQGKQGLRSVQRLNLTLFIDAQNSALSGGFKYSPTTS